MILGKKGQAPWNKGKKTGFNQKQSASLKKRYADGLVNPNKGKKGPSGKDHPMYGRKHSEEARQKMSKTWFKKEHPTWNKGKKASEESKRRMSTSTKKTWENSTHRKRQSESHLGQKSWAKGLTAKNDPRIRRIAEKRKGQKRSEETKRRVSEGLKKAFPDGREPWNKGKKGVMPVPWNKGKPMREELKRKVSSSVKKSFQDGRIVWNKGKPMSEETRRRLIKTMGTPEYRAHLSERRQYIKIPKKDTIPEKILQAFCNSGGIKFQKHKWFNLGFQRAEVDLLLTDYNICILADGDHYHANPNLLNLDGTAKYPPDRVLHKAYKLKPEELVMDKWMIDDMITKGLKKQNYKVLRFWEYDIKNNPEIFRQEIIEAIKEARK